MVGMPLEFIFRPRQKRCGPQSVHVSDPATNYFYEADDPSDGE